MSGQFISETFACVDEFFGDFPVSIILPSVLAALGGRRCDLCALTITIVNSLNALVALFPLLQMRMRVYFLIREQRFKYDCHEWLTWQHGKGEWVHPKFHFCILWSTRCGSRTSDVSPLLSSVFPLCSGGHYNGDNHGVTDMYGKYTQHELDLIANVTHKQCAVTVMHALRRETRHWNGKETFALNPLS